MPQEKRLKVNRYTWSPEEFHLSHTPFISLKITSHLSISQSPYFPTPVKVCKNLFWLNFFFFTYLKEQKRDRMLPSIGSPTEHPQPRAGPGQNHKQETQGPKFLTHQLFFSQSVHQWGTRLKSQQPGLEPGASVQDIGVPSGNLTHHTTTRI